MRGPTAERFVVFTMRVLAASFAVVGILFIATPTSVVENMDKLGENFGTFADGPGTGVKLWLGLAFSYMTVITALALTIQADVVRFRPLLLILAAGKAASSLAAGAYFIWDEDVFIYLLNFLVDGSLVGIALGCWVLAGRLDAPAGEKTAGDGAARAPATTAG